MASKQYVFEDERIYIPGLQTTDGNAIANPFWNSALPYAESKRHAQNLADGGSALVAMQEIMRRCYSVMISPAMNEDFSISADFVVYAEKGCTYVQVKHSSLSDALCEVLEIIKEKGAA